MRVLYRTDQHETTRRRRAVVVSDDFFAAWWTTSEPDEWQTFRCKEGLPEGARLVAVGYEEERNEFRFIFEHESFPEVPTGSRLQDVAVTFERRL